MSKRLQKPFVVLYPAPVTLITCGGGEVKPNIITISWAANLCSQPPMVGIGVRPGRYSYNLIKEGGEFVVNIPRPEMVEVCDRCGTVSGRDVDKFAEFGLTPLPASQVKAPLIAECPVNVECQVRQMLPLGSHHLFIGEVVAVHLDEDCLDQRGRFDHARVGGLVYDAAVSYWNLGRILERYGYTAK
jgi:flavin reductase (DIM6/NTAB) family NADH-FMN oxidoreductase RutF